MKVKKKKKIGAERISDYSELIDKIHARMEASQWAVTPLCAKPRAFSAHSQSEQTWETLAQRRSQVKSSK